MKHVQNNTFYSSLFMAASKVKPWFVCFCFLVVLGSLAFKIAEGASKQTFANYIS